MSVRRCLKGFSAAALTALAAASLMPSPAPVQAEEPQCRGTLLQLSVDEKGTSLIERFRFSLALSGEGRTQQAALDQLNQRLSTLRTSLQPLIQGRLTVPPPSSYRRSAASENPRSFVANTAVSGEVGRRNYNALIQSVGGRPGVQLQGMKSIANSRKQQDLQQQLMASALRRGQIEADATAKVIGASAARLVRIHRNDSIRTTRPMPLAMASRKGFDPAEAPEPSTSVQVQLHYCLR